MMRASGILNHVSSLPSPYGIGTFGAAAFEWIDFLEQAGQRYWQILPLGPTSFGDSPYQSFSTFAGNPYLIDLDLLAAENLLQKEEYEWIDWGNDPAQVDYEKLYCRRFSVLRLAFERAVLRDRQEIEQFRTEQAAWIEDYALFMALKGYFGGKSWDLWPTDIRSRDAQAMVYYRGLLAEEILFWVYLQYQFFNQWRAVRCYAKQKGVAIIGDLPIYVAMDSADVWANPTLFLLDADLRPAWVAGVPPDYFSPDGQKWGNPLYDWSAHQKTGYAWWIERIRATAQMIDLLRIDHFRGFASYYATPATSTHARDGHWEKGPGMAFFDAVHAALGEIPIIAEDLGVLTDDVCELLAESGFPGMKVLQFAFGGNPEDPYLPHNHIPNCVVYTGTHDNNTLVGWWENAAREAEKDSVMQYLGVADETQACSQILRAAWGSVAELAVAPVQDFLELGETARMNEPSTLGKNWKFRLLPGMITQALAERVEVFSALYDRSMQRRM